MSFGSTMQFVRTGTSASCGPTAAPAIAGAATTATLYPYGYRGVATPTKAQTVRQRAAYAGNGFMPLERVESAVSSFADKALARVTKAMTPMDLRLKTQARSGAPAPGSVWDGICYDAESGRVWQKGTSYWSNATLKQDLGTYAWVDVQGFGSYMVENCPGYGRTQPWRAKKFAQPSVRAKRQSADAIRLSTGSGSTRAPSLATFDPRAVLLRRQASAIAGAQRALYAPFDPRHVYRRTRAVARGRQPAGVSTGFAGAGCGASYYAGGCGCTGR